MPALECMRHLNPPFYVSLILRQAVNAEKELSNGGNQNRFQTRFERAQGALKQFMKKPITDE